MKVFFLLSLLFVSTKLYATVDANTRTYIVVQNVQSEEFFVERVPVIGCYGLAKGPQLVQLTAEYKVNANVGCGMDSSSYNLNYLSCAKVKNSVESEDLMNFSELTLDISKCDAKNNPDFINMIYKAVRLNFDSKTHKTKVFLVK